MQKEWVGTVKHVCEKIERVLDFIVKQVGRSGREFLRILESLVAPTFGVSELRARVVGCGSGSKRGMVELTQGSRPLTHVCYVWRQPFHMNPLAQHAQPAPFLSQPLDVGSPLRFEPIGFVSVKTTVACLPIFHHLSEGS